VLSEALGIIGAPERIRTADPQIRSLGSDIDSSQLICKPGIKQLVADQYVSDRAANREGQPPKRNAAEGEQASTGYPIPHGNQTTSKRGVREPSATPGTHRDYQERSQRPAHPSNYLVAQLNATWRVVDDPLQWVLQRKKGNSRKKNCGWQGRSFCRTREALLRCIREVCCSPDQGQSRCIREYRGVDDAALQEVCALPDWHPDWDRGDERTNLDVRGTDQAQAHGQTKALVAQALGDGEAGDPPPTQPSTPLT
jgi:hypothetical protein